MKPLERTTCKAARSLLDWTASDLAREAGMSIGTIRQFESGKTKSLTVQSERAVLDAFDRAGVRVLRVGTDEWGAGAVWKRAARAEAEDVMECATCGALHVSTAAQAQATWSGTGERAASLKQRRRAAPGCNRGSAQGRPEAFAGSSTD